MDKHSSIYVAGHRGLVGSALVRALRSQGFDRLIVRTRAEVDLTDAGATERLFAAEKPEHVFLAAARVGGIQANSTYPADFVSDNLAIQSNVIQAAHRHGVRRLLFLGSSCIYPKLAPQPLHERFLLGGPLEPTNRPYALAKIAGIEMCWSFNRQHGTRFLAAMPTNLYGPGDNYDLQNSHVIPALIRKFHEAKVRGDGSVVVWGTGTPRREFMYSDDMAAACVFLMQLPDDSYLRLLWPGGSVHASVEQGLAPLINVGVGHDISIAELAQLVGVAVDFRGDIVFDTKKPDGTPRKLLDVERLSALGWREARSLDVGLAAAYADFKQQHEAQASAITP
jgi:GDP-L-fucose synthase